MMIAENRHTQVMCRIVVVAILLLCALAVMAEDVTFMSNRRQWEKLPTATLMQMGSIFMNHKVIPDSGMLCYTIVSNRYAPNMTDEDIRHCIHATCNIGRIYTEYYHDFSKAYDYLLNAQEMAEQHQQNDYKAIIQMSLGVLFMKLDPLQPDKHYYKKGLEYHKQAFWQAANSKFYDILPVIFINLNYHSMCHQEYSAIDKEIEAYYKFSIPDTVLKFSFAQSIGKGVDAMRQGKPEEALEVFRNSTIDDNNPSNTAELKIMRNNCIYYALEHLGRYDEALKTLIHNKDFTQKEAPYYIHECYKLLADFYNKQKNQPLAEKYELLYYRAINNLNTTTLSGSIDNVYFLRELDKMNEEQKALTLMQQHDRQMLWVVSGFLALALVLLTLLMINRNRIKQKNRVLYENNVELLAADEQRRKLAELQQRTEAEKYGAIRMDEQSAEELWQNIIHVMEYSPEIYDENFSEPRLAELIEAKQNYVSQAINQQKDWNFSSLVTHYRIREACRRMNDTANYSNYTIEGIGQSVGYSSRSHFVKLFKRQTGLTPSDYMKQCRAGTPPEVLLRPHPLTPSPEGEGESSPA